MRGMCDVTLYQGDYWWRQSDDMMVEYLCNVYDVKNIWHITLYMTSQVNKNGSNIRNCTFLTQIWYIGPTYRGSR